MHIFKKEFKVLAMLVIVICSSCGQESSPEGRMTLKIEDLQQQLLDSLQQHHQALRDSMGQLRREISELKASVQ